MFKAPHFATGYTNMLKPLALKAIRNCHEMELVEVPTPRTGHIFESGYFEWFPFLRDAYLALHKLTPGTEQAEIIKTALNDAAKILLSDHPTMVPSMDKLRVFRYTSTMCSLTAEERSLSNLRSIAVVLAEDATRKVEDGENPHALRLDINRPIGNLNYEELKRTLAVLSFPVEITTLEDRLSALPRPVHIVSSTATVLAPENTIVARRLRLTFTLSEDYISSLARDLIRESIQRRNPSCYAQWQDNQFIVETSMASDVQLKDTLGWRSQIEAQLETDMALMVAHANKSFSAVHNEPDNYGYHNVLMSWMLYGMTDPKTGQPGISPNDTYNL